VLKLSSLEKVEVRKLTLEKGISGWRGEPDNLITDNLIRVSRQKWRNLVVLSSIFIYFHIVLEKQYPKVETLHMI
jgi:hypothetical protein